MVVHPARLALKLADGIDQAALGSLGLQFERGLSGGYSVYSSDSDAPIDRTKLIGTGLIEDAVSVFFVQSSRSEAVVLDEVIVALKAGVTEQEFFNNNTLFVSHQPLKGTPDQFIARVADGNGEVALHVANVLGRIRGRRLQRPTFIRIGRGSLHPMTLASPIFGI